MQAEIILENVNDFVKGTTAITAFTAIQQKCWILSIQGGGGLSGEGVKNLVFCKFHVSQSRKNVA